MADGAGVRAESAGRYSTPSTCISCAKSDWPSSTPAGAARGAAAAKRAEELALIRKADVTLVVSDVEQELLKELAPQARVIVLSNIHDRHGPGSPFAAAVRLAVRRRLPPSPEHRCRPLVRERHPAAHPEGLPGVKTYIVGADPPATIRALAADDLVIAGYVPDLAPYLEGCRLSISPLRYGAGVKGKVNQAMSFGLPVVATTPSIEGMHLTPGSDVLVGDDPQAFRRRGDARVSAIRRYGNGSPQAVATTSAGTFRASVARAAIAELLALSDVKGRGGDPRRG